MTNGLCNQPLIGAYLAPIPVEGVGNYAPPSDEQDEAK